MQESFSNQNQKKQETGFKPAPELVEANSAEAIQADITEAKRLYEDGEFKKALDMLDVAIDKAYRAKNGELYDQIVDLMDEYEGSE